MTYKEMTTPQLINEIARVKELLVLNKKPHTFHQNRKYLSKLENEYKRRVYEKKDNWTRTKVIR